MNTSTFDQNAEIERLVRQDWGRILASLVKQLRDIQLAEDCLQDAVVSAMKSWQKGGFPKSPAAWLLSVAKRKGIDRIRRTQTHHQNQTELSYMLDAEHQQEAEMDMDRIPDERLEMIFTCCHPAIEEKARVALTLRTLGGLSVDEIAKAFLDKPEAMAQRLVRAKRKISLAGIPYQIPDKSQIADRLTAVLKVIYLIFNEGYASRNEQQLIRSSLSDEAIRLSRVVMLLLGDNQQGAAESRGLLALMLLHDSRRNARVDECGQLVQLEKQDRDLWNKDQIEEGRTLVKSALALQNLGPYQLQAAISALHSEAETWADTDWPQIDALYNLLYKMQPSPVVKLNHALAVSFSKSPTTALVMIEELEAAGRLQTYYHFHLAKADILVRNQQLERAKPNFVKALELCINPQEISFIINKMHELGLVPTSH